MYTILEDDLFKSFMSKLAETPFTEEKKKELLDLTIQAMMETQGYESKGILNNAIWSFVQYR